MSSRRGWDQPLRQPHRRHRGREWRRGREAPPVHAAAADADAVAAAGGPRAREGREGGPGGGARPAGGTDGVSPGRQEELREVKPEKKPFES